MNLQNILRAKELRTEKRLAFAKEGFASISHTFNIPGSEKSNKNIKKAFDYSLLMLEDFLLANRILTDKTQNTRITDAAGDFYLTPVIETTKTIDQIKELCEKFEEKHPLGRIIDVDIFSNSAKPVSSQKAKKCFICEKPAMVCMQEQNHSIEDLSSYIAKNINGFIQSKVLKETKIKLSALATQCLLYEISLSPKPGLVDKFGTGAHKDMDYFSFLNSTSALSNYWGQLVDLANKNQQENELPDEIEELRMVGIAMERTMLEFTNGVNTQKGAIFLIGMLVYVAAKLIFKETELSDKNIRDELIRLNNNNLEDDILKTKTTPSHGQKIFEKFGKITGGGIRKELAEGLPIVFEQAVPVLRNENINKFFRSEKTAKPVLTRCLLRIISLNNDSNVLFRSDLKTLKQLKGLANNCLKNQGSFEADYEKLCQFCIHKNISPGGSADLLAASIFIYQLQNTI